MSTDKKLSLLENVRALSAKLKANIQHDIQHEPVAPATPEEERMMAPLAKEDEPVVESEEQRLFYEKHKINQKEAEIGGIKKASDIKEIDGIDKTVVINKPLSYQVVVSEDGIHDFFTINEVYVPKGYNGATKSFCSNIGYKKIRSFFSERPRLIGKYKLSVTNIEISKEFIAACLMSMEFSENKEFMKELPT